MTKKYGGVINAWFKSETRDDWKTVYGGSLGYYMMGRLGTDPTGRGFDNEFLRTSLVVKFDEKQIETLNTIYDLGEERMPMGDGDC